MDSRNSFAERMPLKRLHLSSTVFRALQLPLVKRCTLASGSAYSASSEPQSRRALPTSAMSLLGM